MRTEQKNPPATTSKASVAKVASSESAERVIPILAEEVEVEKQVRETGRVHVHKTVQQHEEVVDEPLVQETVEIQRVPINRVIERPIPTRQEGDTTIISVTKEVLVVEKRLMFTEEVRITRRRSEFHDPQRVDLQSEEIVIEHLPVAEGPTS